MDSGTSLSPAFLTCLITHCTPGKGSEPLCAFVVAAETTKQSQVLGLHSSLSILVGLKSNIYSVWRKGCIARVMTMWWLVVDAKGRSFSLHSLDLARPRNPHLSRLSPRGDGGHFNWSHGLPGLCEPLPLGTADRH